MVQSGEDEGGDSEEGYRMTPSVFISFCAVVEARTCSSQFFLSTVWIPGTKLKSPGSGARALTSWARMRSFV